MNTRNEFAPSTTRQQRIDAILRYWHSLLPGVREMLIKEHDVMFSCTDKIIFDILSALNQTPEKG